MNAECGINSIHIHSEFRVPHSEVVDEDALLAGEEGEVTPQLQDERLQLAEDRLLYVLFEVGAGQTQEVEEIGVAKDQVGRHLVLVPERGDVPGDQLVRLLAYGRPFEQQVANLVPERPSAPPLGPAQLGVALALQRIVDWQQPPLPGCVGGGGRSGAAYQQLRQLTEPKVVGGRSYAGFNPARSKDVRLFKAVGRLLKRLHVRQFGGKGPAHTTLASDGTRPKPPRLGCTALSLILATTGGLAGW